ncbi:putative PEP-binding protein [Maritalea sp.]|uniref:putative PEP-binding protein n=1 Tax=Maritalea sp. TaxID=2003361 RepID=UPI003EFA27A7
MFAIAPANERPHLSREQERLIAGKAAWIFAMAKSGQSVCPTICITRKAWEAVKDAKPGSSLHTSWIGVLFKLVPKGMEPPALVVRTAARAHMAGLARVRGKIEAPKKESDAANTAKPLGRAIDRAFDSYLHGTPVWTMDTGRDLSLEQIVLVQAAVAEKPIAILTRDLSTGELGPFSTTDKSQLHPFKNPMAAKQLCRRMDGVAGAHMICLVAEQNGELLFLSARPAQASISANLEAAIDRVSNGDWTPRKAVSAIDPAQLPQVLHPRLSGAKRVAALASGLGVSPGAASGAIVFSSEDASRYRARGKDCILVSVETGPSDIEGMQAAAGILTARGGITSHAAVIARVTGKPCVASVRSLSIDVDLQKVQIGEREILAGAEITIDGSTGEVYAGALPLTQPHIGGNLRTLLDWADGSRTIAVRTNVETEEAAKVALSFGAEGIGLARSEHMFFSTERMVALRRMIFSQNDHDRKQALDGLVEYQADDYARLFSTMDGLPITVRLFDPPLHEFLPRTEDELEDTASSLGIDTKRLRNRLERMAEVNPMLGHRGCRLAISHPEILDMQIRALVAGARAAIESNDTNVNLEIMVPFVSSAREVHWVRNKILQLMERLSVNQTDSFKFSIGTMIELPRAALRAHEIAKHVDFFSFGTNDLTQTTFGISRDDAPAFLATYQRRGLYDADPFVTIDKNGVGELIEIAIRRGKEANPDLKIGICGEHAGDPESLKYFASLDVDYVSCSPFRLPIARLALAQPER